MSPLGRMLADEIARSGPIGLDRFMAAALGDPEHGYYTGRDPLGPDGDFITAPEISQIFGEILALVLADGWDRLGRPAPVGIVELGPGRGTLAADLWRALAVMPELRRAAELHLVETSPVLRAIQRRTLYDHHPDLRPVWHDRIDTVPDRPMLMVANEFFDALPIRQFVHREDGWHERLVGLDAEGGFGFLEGPRSTPPSAPPTPAPMAGAIRECSPAAIEVAAALGSRLARHPGLALIIDYGSASYRFGASFQAVRGHRRAEPLVDPGLSDLTAHVDFAALAEALRGAGAAVWPAVSQGRFLSANGALVRAERLMRGRPADEARAIRAALDRLVGDEGMGQLFKVLAAGSPGLAPPAGCVP